MKQIRAVYENGVFRPVEDVQLQPGTSVTVNVNDQASAAKPWMKYFGSIPAAEASAMAAAIEEEFEQVRLDEWR